MDAYPARLARLRERFEAPGITALLVTQAENRYYLSGFTGDAGALFITPEHAFLATDSRYWEQAERQAPDYQLVRLKSRLEESPAELLEQVGQPKRVWFESAAVTVDQFIIWQAANAVEWLPAKNMVEPLRAVKEEAELALIRKAVALTDAGFDFVCGLLKPGLTEAEVAWQLEVYLRTHGAEALAFETIVASGPNGAMVHHRAGPRALQPGEPIVIDFGAMTDGYRSDMTRTVSLGHADAKYAEVFEVVYRAQQAALEGIHAGMTGAEADATARTVIVAAGYGEHFGHGLGHGVGLAIHEAPRASRLAATERLPAGATLTVEPGVYLAGWGGVRLEDLVVVREAGVEVLSRSHKRSII
ncbi:MAG TPA: Xaa-Pro peptidase family protein [Anaerolineae bacterium]|nr:Xaa-Pro peptidase family protein [Anaerolineae bacterium]